MKNRPILQFLSKNKFFCSVLFLQNLTVLNLSAQIQLSPSDLCVCIETMDNLTCLNLSNTQTNYQVAHMISLTCTKLRFLNLKCCVKLFEDCIERLCINLCETIEQLNIDQIPVSEEIVEFILKKCKKLRFFNTSQLSKVILALFTKRYA